MDAGELPREALARELMEEVGLEVEVGILLDIFPMVTASGANGGIVIAYRVAPSGQKLPQPLRNDDAEAARWFTAGEIPNDIAFESTRELLRKWRDGSL
jgi:8-oxo-dGTP diphosphatase